MEKYSALDRFGKNAYNNIMLDKIKWAIEPI